MRRTCFEQCPTLLAEWPESGRRPIFEEVLKSTFHIPLMDCPSEESQIRIKLSEFTAIRSLDFDIANRTLIVYHDKELPALEEAIASLRMKGQLVDSVTTDEVITEEASDQRRLLWIVLLINFLFFIIESTTGWISQSMGLVADSFDMLADALVYGISLLAVGKGLIRKKRVANIAGYLQLGLAIAGFSEIIRRFFAGTALPDFQLMIIVSALALVANGICLYLLQSSRGKEEAHMKASMIFTSNDIIINIGVIIAGLLVLWTGSSLPDLLIGSVVFILVFRGALRILSLGK